MDDRATKLTVPSNGNGYFDEDDIIVDDPIHVKTSSYYSGLAMEDEYFGIIQYPLGQSMNMLNVPMKVVASGSYSWS